MRSNQLRGPWTCAMALFLISLFPVSARAQFSGPGPDITTPVNPPVSITTDPAILFPGPRDFTLGVADLLAVHLYDGGDYASGVRVSLDGSVQLPLIGTLHVDGLTLHQAQDLIAKRLVEEGMYQNPQVSIQVLESPNEVATVVGEVHGIVPILGQKRLLDVLSAAGSGSGSGAATTVVLGGSNLPNTASHLITIQRPGVTEPITVNLGTDPAKSALANIPIFPRDTIIVPRVGVVYVLGAFKSQGAIPMPENSPLTLMKLAALAGGPGFEGRANDLRIIRTNGFNRQVVNIDIKKVIDGKAPDPVLQAEDIVFLPSNPMKAAIKSGGLSTVLGLASVLVVALRQ